MSGFRLAVSAEMVFLDLPFEQRVRRIDDFGFEVELCWPTPTAPRSCCAPPSSRCGSPKGSTARGSTSTAPGSTTRASPSWPPRWSPRRCGCRPPGPWPGTPFARAADTLALVEAVGSPHLRMNLDLYHAQIGEGSLVQLVERALPLVGEIQVADVPGRREPGTGQINYPAVAAALDWLGYTGVVGLEAWASGDPVLALERFRAAFSVPTPPS